MGNDETTFIAPIIDGHKDWRDKIYLIIPKEYTESDLSEIYPPACICGENLTKMGFDELKVRIESAEKRNMSYMINNLMLSTNNNHSEEEEKKPTTYSQIEERLQSKNI